MHTENTPRTADRNKEAGNQLVFSYLALRNFIGYCGVFLPLLLIIFTRTIGHDRAVENAISDYYYTSAGELFVVLMSVLGVFLFTYKGYERNENLLTSFAGLCALGVVFNPTRTKYLRESFTVHSAHESVAKINSFEVHLLFAGCFFIALAIMSLKYFPKTDASELQDAKGHRTQKAKRNIIYRICGWTILISMGILIVYFLCKPVKEWVGDFPLTFIMETLAVEAFGISWLTKGETFWPDGEHYFVTGFKWMKQKI